MLRSARGTQLLCALEDILSFQSFCDPLIPMGVIEQHSPGHCSYRPVSETHSPVGGKGFLQLFLPLSLLVLE